MFKSQSHRLFGAILLIAGCCIGAGMLGLPLMTAAAGFLPTVVAFIASWLFMASTGLLLLEVNLWFGRGVNLMSLAEFTLGKGARWFIALLFCFLFYCLMVAYLAGGGAIVAEFMGDLFGIDSAPFHGSLGLVFIFGIVIYFGTTAVDQVNRWLMGGLAASYLGLIALGLPRIETENLAHAAWGSAVPALPAMIISFGFHNLVPSLTDYLEGNVRALRLAVVIGSGIPLLLYLLWDFVILGLLPRGETLQSALEEGAMVTTLLKGGVGGSYVFGLTQSFAFFALITSFVAVALSFVDFLADGLKVGKKGGASLFLIGLVLLPPLAFAYLYPSIFLSALNYAGAFGAVILFGLVPVAMAWKGRYFEGRKGARLLPGGKPLLVAIAAFALFVFFLQLKNELGV